MKILNQKKTTEGDMLYLIGYRSPEYVIKVTDRHSRVLNRPVTETIAYTAQPPKPGKPAGAQGVFHSSCCEPPVLRLPVASLETAASSLESSTGHDDAIAAAGDDLRDCRDGSDSVGGVA